jgi:hypothetical protein
MLARLLVRILHAAIQVDCSISGTGVVGGCLVVQTDVKEGREGHHVFRHVVGPLEYLWSDVHEECVRRPAPEDHDLRSGMILEEERHRGAGSDEAISDFVEVEAKHGFASEHGAGGTEELEGELVREERH